MMMSPRTKTKVLKARRQRSSSLVSLLFILIISFVNAAAADNEEEHIRTIDLINQEPAKNVKPNFAAQLAGQKDMVLQAARFADAIYRTEGQEGVINRFEDLDGQENVKSIAMESETSDDNFCYFAFSGKNEGFEWMNNMDLRVSKITAASNGKKCRVVRHYRKLYSQASYRQAILSAAQACLDADLQVVFTGHDLGGAIATLYGLSTVAASAPDRVWMITFGQPPVFVPTNRGSKHKALLKNPCPGGFNYATYIRVINSEPPNDMPGLGYDFVPYLNIFMKAYSTERKRERAMFPPLQELMPDCLQYPVQYVNGMLLEEEHKRPKSLGAAWGAFAVLPPTPAGNSSRLLEIHGPVRLFYQRAAVEKRQSFRNADMYGIRPEMLLVPDVCFDARGTIHGMDEYLRKLENFKDVADFMDSYYRGFYMGTPCNFDKECFALNHDYGICLSDQQSENRDSFLTCLDPDGRPPRKWKPMNKGGKK